jgi:hypothetical protein
MVVRSVIACVVSSAIVACLPGPVSAAPTQDVPRALHADIRVEHYMEVAPRSVRLVFDEHSGRMYYNTFEGDVYRIAGRGESELLYTSDDHGITRLQGIVFQILRDVTVRTANLRAGKIDLAYMVAQKDLFTLERDRNLLVDKRITTEFYKAFMNKGREPMNQTALRQAISYALEREAILLYEA